MNQNGKAQQRLCICKWVKCEKLRESVMSSLSPNHVWTQKIIRIDIKDKDMDTMSINKFALHNSISRHILKEENKNELLSYIFLYPHHFPIALLSWMKETSSSFSFLKPLSFEQAKIVDGNHLGTQQFKDNSNSVLFYHNTGLRKKKLKRKILKDAGFNKVYVKSPLTLQHEIDSLINPNKLPKKRSIEAMLQNTNSLVSSVRYIECTHEKPSTPTKTLSPFKNIRPISPPIVPEVQQLQSMLLAKYSTYGDDISVFNARPSVIEISKLLATYHGNFDMIKLSDNVYYYPCRTSSRDHFDTCQYFKVLTRRYERNIFCEPCTQRIIKQDRKCKRMIESPTRSRPFNSLSPEKKQEVYQNQKYKLKLVHNKYDLLITKLKSKKNKLAFDDDSPAKMELQQACDFIKSNWSLCKNDLIKTLLDIQSKDDDVNQVKKFSNEDTDKLVSYLTESIENLALQLNDKDRQCRYSSHAINMSMSLFLKNKSMYEEIRDSKGLSLPSRNTLMEKQSILKSSPGIDPNCMQFVKDLKKKNKR